jgi:hypothetical protein
MGFITLFNNIGLHSGLSFKFLAVRLIMIMSLSTYLSKAYPKKQ